MRRKVTLAIGVVALALVTLSLATGASSQTSVRNGWLGTGNEGAARRPVQSLGAANEHVLRAVLVIRNFAFNTNPDGFDEFALSGPLFNAAHTRRIGFMAGHCTFASPEISECELTANFGAPFPRGSSISVQGLSSPATHWFNAITGGTGRYDDASGEVEARNVGSDIALIFHLED
jgi:hypothetical protein